MLRILIVDDDPLVCKAIKRHLDRAGFIVHVAHTALHAADVISRENVQVAIIDWDLGGQTNGVALGRAVRRQGIATFMISGYSKQQVRAEWKDPLEGFLQFYQKGEEGFFAHLVSDLERIEKSLEDTEP